MAGCSVALATRPDALIQIRRRYEANLGALRLTVEAESGVCEAEVRENGALLYSARRGNVPAAQAVAVEYAAFRMPSAMAGNTARWRESWL